MGNPRMNNQPGGLGFKIWFGRVQKVPTIWCWSDETSIWKLFSDHGRVVNLNPCTCGRATWFTNLTHWGEHPRLEKNGSSWWCPRIWHRAWYYNNPIRLKPKNKHHTNQDPPRSLKVCFWFWFRVFDPDSLAGWPSDGVGWNLGRDGDHWS